MKKRFLTLLILLISISEIFSQYYTKDTETTTSRSGIFEDWKQKVFFGGNFGMSFLKYYSYVDISPIIGYKIHEKLSIGAKLSYIYLKSRLAYNLQYSNTTTVSKIITYDYSSHIFGVSPFASVFVTDFFFIHGEYNLYNGEIIHTKTTPEYFWTTREFIAVPLAGGGINYKLGSKGGILIMALYNFSYLQNRGKFPLYQSPIIYRIGFYF